MCFPGVLGCNTIPPKDILPQRDGLHVSRIDAAPVSTEVIEHTPFWYWAYKKLIAKPVGIDDTMTSIFSAANANSPISTGDNGALPEPATIGFFDLGPKTLFK